MRQVPVESFPECPGRLHEGHDIRKIDCGKILLQTFRHERPLSANQFINLRTAHGDLFAIASDQSQTSARFTLQHPRMLQPIFGHNRVNQKLGFHGLVGIQNRRQQCICRPILQRRQIGPDFPANVLQPMTRCTTLFKHQLTCRRLFIFEISDFRFET